MGDPVYSENIKQKSTKTIELACAMRTTTFDTFADRIGARGAP